MLLEVLTKIKKSPKRQTINQITSKKAQEKLQKENILDELLKSQLIKNQTKQKKVQKKRKAPKLDNEQEGSRKRNASKLSKETDNPVNQELDEVEEVIASTSQTTTPSKQSKYIH